MNAVQVHLFLTHLPIFGILIGSAILAYGYFAKNKSIKNVALVLYLAMAIATIPVYISGEESEEILEHKASYSHELIHEHEEHAEKAVWLVAILAAIAIFNLYAISKDLKSEKLATQLSLVISLLCLGALIGTAKHGGEIKHDEIYEHNLSHRANSSNKDI